MSAYPFSPDSPGLHRAPGFTAAPDGAGVCSYARFDAQGRLLDWNTGFERELAPARELIAPGVAWGALLRHLCTHGGVAEAAALCGEDPAALRVRLDGPPAPPRVPHHHEYEHGLLQRLRVQVAGTRGGAVVRWAGPAPVWARQDEPAGAAVRFGTLASGDGAGRSWSTGAAGDAPGSKDLATDAALGFPPGLPRQPMAQTADRREGDSSEGQAASLPDRARFLDVLEAEWQRAFYTQSALAVALIDLDLQRAYVKRHGEPAAAALLDRVAAELGQGIVRSTDLVARYGDKCFALMLTGASFAIAAVVAERARTAVAHLDLPHPDSPHGQVTASIGFASTVPATDTGARQLVEAAEAALLQAKLNGRNLVMGGAISHLLIDA